MPLGILSWFFDPPPPGAITAPSLPWPRRIEDMLIINRLPIQRTGLVLQRPTGWLDDLSATTPQTARIRGLTGGRYEALPESLPRAITLEGWLIDVRHEDLQQVLQGVRAWLGTGLLELQWPHARDYLQRGMAGQIITTPLNPDKAFTTPDRQTWRVSIPITCADSLAYSRHPRRIRLSTTPRPIRVGAASVGGEILLTGPITGALDIDILSPSGVLLHRLPLRGVALEEGDVCKIRLDAPRTIAKRTPAGVTTNVYHWRDFTISPEWPVVSPEHSDPERAQWPRVRLSTGAGWWVYPLAAAA